ncbi:AGC protein kinase [Thecamonas trahens ATCC 50062]|uniref:non-specific serine/threonine protein kinase n=1 Tax=Thecamonas trahens ATCC 50062 TaxID=461836 RepID=A0A0L0DM42_THETB|nr:AGC protein kinase [Thecamonas trahens ATCC 50062]KNC53382.1 AGC protein kinase [Thecamonas trahens ATCC 50062]|eukprot:XP_013754427.1 AGC protein kinase [Thecamonas trahens ATCC 50062]
MGSRNGKSMKLSDFEKDAVVGDGAFGHVYRVVENATGKVYALKSMIRSPDHSDEVWEKLKREVELQRKASSSPFVTTYRYTFEENEKVYIVLDYIGGGDLFYQVKSANGGLPLDAVRFYTAEVMVALEHLHSLGIVFRDLKLENVLIAEDGHVKLSDFGLAKQLLLRASEQRSRRRSRTRARDDAAAGGDSGSLRSTSTFCGTKYYMAPEMVNNRRYAMSVDFWSLGVLVYSMLTGHYPFMSPDRTELFNMIRHDEVLYPETLPDDAVDFVDALMEKDTALRLSSFDDIRAHPFLRSIDWDAAAARELTPPAVPGDIAVDIYKELTGQAPSPSSSRRKKRRHKSRSRKSDTTAAAATGAAGVDSNVSGKVEPKPHKTRKRKKKRSSRPSPREASPSGDEQPPPVCAAQRNVDNI